MSTTSTRRFDGPAFKRHRENAGFSVAALAAATGLSPGGIHKLEQGHRVKPRPSTYLRLIKCLRLKEGDLMIDVPADSESAENTPAASS